MYAGKGHLCFDVIRGQARNITVDRFYLPYFISPCGLIWITGLFDNYRPRSLRGGYFPRSLRGGYLPCSVWCWCLGNLADAMGTLSFFMMGNHGKFPMESWAIMVSFPWNLGQLNRLMGRMSVNFGQLIRRNGKVVHFHGLNIMGSLSLGKLAMDSTTL